MFNSSQRSFFPLFNFKRTCFFSTSFLFSFFTVPDSMLQAKAYSLVEEQYVVSKIQAAIKDNKYLRLGKILEQNVGKTITLTQVRQIARELNASKLLSAIDATKELFGRKANRFGITRSEFLQIALFIESKLAGAIEKKEYYLKKEKTELRCSLDYDPDTQKVFLILPEIRGNFLGEGANKIVTRSVMYNQGHPEVVARALQTRVKKDEMRMMRAVQGLQGVFNILACTKYDLRGKTYRVIYSKLYSPGSLYNAFSKEYSFSLFEKIKITRGLLKGLYELHKKNIAHRDIASKNFLINVPQGDIGYRDIDAVIADFGAARLVADTTSKKNQAQGHLIYTPPEAIIKKLSGEEFFLSDVYATGCIFYRLFYGEFAPWQSTKYVVETEIPAKKRYNELVRRIKRYTFSRKNYLERKSTEDVLSLSEDFELLILRMVDPDPKKRGTTESLYKEMKRISRCQ